MSQNNVLSLARFMSVRVRKGYKLLSLVDRKCVIVFAACSDWLYDNA